MLHHKETLQSCFYYNPLSPPLPPGFWRTESVNSHVGVTVFEVVYVCVCVWGRGGGGVFRLETFTDHIFITFLAYRSSRL